MLKRGLLIFLCFYLLPTVIAAGCNVISETSICSTTRKHECLTFYNAYLNGCKWCRDISQCIMHHTCCDDAEYYTLSKLAIAIISSISSIFLITVVGGCIVFLILWFNRRRNQSLTSENIYTL